EPFSVHTRWIETEFTNVIEPFTGGAGTGAGAEGEEGVPRETVVVEVGGKRVEVSLPATLATPLAGAAPAGGGAPARRRRTTRRGTAAPPGDTLTSPMQGTVVKVAVSEGHEVTEGELIVVLEAMKMEQPIHAHRTGTVANLKAEAGGSLATGAVICQIRD
ncbi:acetyl-CoA carboxylase biotin carboxyl carrier protein subunit, partial [Streptomyces synnematoformans]|uniref:acetyl-CoA carboxylase biotin carboxyl carrier protein subunit n=1 Tax=Streptomyces synnematoformans TaxID=415721 RepID=UPI0031D29835